MKTIINFYLNIDKLKANFDAYSKIGRIYYPLKTNSNKVVITALNELYQETNNGFLITHFSHYEQLISQEITPDKMCLVNVMASDELVKRLYDNGVRYFTFDNIKSLSNFLEYADPNEVKIAIRFSITEAFDEFSHLGANSKECKEMFDILKSKNITNYGISFYLQKELLPQSKVLNVMLDYIKNNFSGYNMSFINIGGAIKPNEIDISKLEETKKELNAKETIIEPGRYLVGNAGHMETQIVKQKYDNVFIIDSGIYAGLLDAKLYNKKFELRLKTTAPHEEVIILSKESFENSRKIIICGASSDSGDSLGKFYIAEKHFDKLKVGATIIVSNALAYVEEFFMKLGGDLTIKYNVTGGMQNKTKEDDFENKKNKK